MCAAWAGSTTLRKINLTTRTATTKKRHSSQKRGRSFFVFIQIFICAYIVWAISPSCTPTPSLSSPLPSLLGQTCSALFSNFVEEKT
jgi:hypothetical protein